MSRGHGLFNERFLVGDTFNACKHAALARFVL